MHLDQHIHQSHFCETRFSPWRMMYFSIVTLCLYLLHLIWAVFAKTAILPLTFNRIIFSNNIQKWSLQSNCFDCTISNIRNYTISSSHSLSSHYRSPNSYPLQREILPQDYLGRQRNSLGRVSLLAAAPPSETCSCPTSARSHFYYYHRYPTFYRRYTFIFHSLLVQSRLQVM